MKEIHQCSPYSIALSKLLVYTKDLGPTRIDFNLGTPRSEIPSHYPMVSHSPCDLSDLNTNKKMKLPSNKLPNTVLHSFAVVHNLPSFLLQSLGVENMSLQLNKQSQTCITNDTREEHTQKTTQKPKKSILLSIDGFDTQLKVMLSASR